MKSEKNFIKILIVAITLLTVTGCNEESSTTKIKVSDSLNANTTKIESSMGGILVYTKYNIPLPVEIYKLLKKNNKQFNKELLNTVENFSKYNTNIQKSINLGVYTSDLAYCTLFDKNQEAIIYYQTSSELAMDLHIDKGFSQSFINRMYSNINNYDSLRTIASDSYWEACNYLENNDRINILPFVVSGGWLESMYLILNNVNIKAPEAEILQRIAEQKTALQNLMQYLLDVMIDSNTFEVNEEVQELGIKLGELKKIYDTVKNNTINEEQFVEISKKIKAIRDNYIY